MAIWSWMPSRRITQGSNYINPGDIKGQAFEQHFSVAKIAVAVMSEAVKG